MNTFNLFRKWLLIIWAAMWIAGLLLLLWGWSQFSPAEDPFVKHLFQNGDVNPAMKTYYHWIYGVMGAVFIGWSTMVIYLLQNAFKRREIWAWKAILISTLFWIIPDSVTSWYFDINLNVISNTVILLLILIPIIGSRKYFQQQAMVE